MKNPFNRAPKFEIDINEIKDYVDSLERVTALRDKATVPSQRNDYDRSIHVMQEVLIFLNTMPKK